ncbi:iron-sulfur protein [Streptomyces nigrescens]|uniref:Cytochrome bc1 complex Rieske iron-sulfur subunit n=1 Tax=Streptomyces nigrescens TaxID=1920 RepID=A0ABN6QRW1_STRNI|nr:iron-sulfur protein [Streptomyces nigrescens]
MARQAATGRTETAATGTEETVPARPCCGMARRTVVAAAGAAGLTAALAACGNDMADSGSGDKAAAGNGAAGAGGSEAGSGAGAAGKELAKAAEIPQGGGKIFKAEKVVVTQPQNGEIKAFSAVCPHAGCVVNEVSGGTINCPCHGSKFDITDGSVKHGPATKGLPPAKVSVKGGAVTLG